jgi:hypothetical protein
MAAIVREFRLIPLLGILCDGSSLEHKRCVAIVVLCLDR